MDIYMSSNNYFCLLLYLSRKELCRRIGLRHFCQTFAVRRLQAYSSASLLSPLV